jgi:hypothetical protein
MNLKAIDNKYGNIYLNYRECLKFYFPTINKWEIEKGNNRIISIFPGSRKSFRNIPFIIINHIKDINSINYGFELIKHEEANRMGFPSASETFDSLYNCMKKEAKYKKIFIRDALKMSNHEKEISFLNRYFIFKKVTELSQSTLNNIQKILLEKDEMLQNMELEQIY